MAQPDNLESLKIQNTFKNFSTVLYVIKKKEKTSQWIEKRDTLMGQGSYGEYFIEERQQESWREEGRLIFGDRCERREEEKREIKGDKD